ncbi:lysosome-associated membrane glycoprotein 5 [Lycorma delicatula]|uniref:lysosome-associated membrane glycoprotein 5 n=1 Tax=Lycorma delicatula TaxID=130591 RepID=UPI003F512D5A
MDRLVQQTTCILTIATILLGLLDTRLGVSGQNDSAAENGAALENSRTQDNSVTEIAPAVSVSLNAEDLKVTTRKAEKKEPNTKTTTTESSPDSAPLYKLKNEEDGMICILIRMDAILNYTYTSKLGERQEKDQYVPDSPAISGECNDDDSKITLTWQKDFRLTFNFRKTPGGERWFVESVELKVDSSNRFFEHFKDKGKEFVLSSKYKQRTLLFPTPVGQAYTCHKELKLILSNPSTDLTARLYFLEFKIEPFIFKNDDFGQEYKCSNLGAGPYRSETAPLIVGSTLAFMCLATVTGYGIFRYFKIKKVQYDTME